MGVKCAKCGETMDGVVTQDTLRERLAAKDTQIAELREGAKEIATLREQLAAGETARRELEEIRAERERADAFGKHAIVEDQKVRDRLWRYYRAEVIGAENPPAFADWLGADDTRAVFGPHYRPAGAGTAAKTATAGAATGAAAAGSAAKTEPARNAAGTTGEVASTAGAGKAAAFPSAKQIAAEFADPAFQALPPKERLAKIAEREKAWKESRAKTTA